jgi:dolichol kinase
MPMGAVAMDESQTPPNLYLLEYILTLAIAAVVGTIAYKSAQSPKNLLASAGVSVRKVARAVREIERKTFHLAGLLVPLIHQLMLSNGFSNASCVRLCWAITITGVCADALRLKVDVVRRNWPMRQLLREHEQKQMTGGSSFSLGCTLTIAISPPSIAMASVLFLILGDMCAAVIGVSFGHEACTLKLGRTGKKSIEGSVAMFAVCFLVGSTVFAHVHLREYPVFFGALAATLTEVYEPLGLNDNLTIPLFSSIALQWGFARIQTCAAQPPLGWLKEAYLALR